MLEVLGVDSGLEVDLRYPVPLPTLSTRFPGRTVSSSRICAYMKRRSVRATSGWRKRDGQRAAHVRGRLVDHADFQRLVVIDF